MADYSYNDLDKLLVQVRRIEEHRVKGAEKEIKKAYEGLLQELRHYLADTYSHYAEEDRLTYGILQKHGYYARFLEEVEKKIASVSPEVKRLIRSTVEQTYAATYDGLVEAVKKAGGGHMDFDGLKGCTPEVMRRAVENPISKLTLDDRLEKHRKEIVRDIKQNISVGLMNGDGYSTMANRIKRSLNGDYKKAIRITRTETHRVRQAGEWDSAMETDKALQAGTSGMRMTKTWKTMKDERVRPANRYKTKKGWKNGNPGKYDHKSMDGVTLLVDEEFKLPSGARAQYPGGSGVAGEDINCRCYLSYNKLKKVAETNNSSYNKIRNSVLEIKDFNELRQYVENTYDIAMDDAVAVLDFETVKQSLMGIENIISEFPEVGSMLKHIETGKSGVMSCSGAKVTFNPIYFTDSSTLKNLCGQQSDFGYWIPNSSPASIGVHEAAHGIEWVLIHVNASYDYDYERILAWNKSAEAKGIISQAVKNIKKTSYGKGKKKTDLIKAISGYAGYNDSETMAEAFADVYANGADANPLSVEIRRLTIEKLKQYKEGSLS